MRIGELSRRTGIPVPTIKFYLREGLLAYGERVAANQVHYDEQHERRLRLVRALIEVAGLPVAATRDVLAAVDEPERSAFKTLGVLHDAVSGDRPTPDHPTADRSAPGGVAELLDRHGWIVGDGNPGHARLTELITTLEALGRHDVLARLDAYADLAGRLADLDMDMLFSGGAGAGDEADARLESLVVLTALGDELVAALRHLAQTDRARRRLHPNG